MPIVDRTKPDDEVYKKELREICKEHPWQPIEHVRGKYGYLNFDWRSYLNQNKRFIAEFVEERVNLEEALKFQGLYIQAIMRKKEVEFLDSIFETEQHS